MRAEREIEDFRRFRGIFFLRSKQSKSKGLFILFLRLDFHAENLNYKVIYINQS